ncbi:hypothetical protein JCM19301_1860 [Jejuia pallidilutea]|uniref:Uncharacterized protein n=1 Tax=Jejuia pallidilutea TaxID=504487 RepID=A0A090VTA3_9FLAO|nr:hypothetical protein JCM19301_1860 [Jejuia pallidilutea]
MGNGFYEHNISRKSSPESDEYFVLRGIAEASKTANMPRSSN